MDSPITNFYSRASREARLREDAREGDEEDFYSRASREARLKGFIDGTWSQLFLLTRLSRGATLTKDVELNYTAISTHAPLARRDKNAEREYGKILISTHAPLARRHFRQKLILGIRGHFYSRASREARRTHWT